MDADEIGCIGVVGAGLMGHGIALQFALGGYDVRLNDVSEDRLEAALDNVRATLVMLEEMNLVNAADAGRAPDRISTSTSLEEAVSEVDFVVEAVFEDLPLKQSVFADLDRFAPARAILSSNTSSFMSSQLAPSTNRPGQVVVGELVEPAVPAAPHRGGEGAGDQ